MKITALYVYPIKALRGIPITQAELTPQGIKHDRSFMLYTVKPNGEWKKMQLSSFPQCALFEQNIVTAEDGTQEIVVQYHAPKTGSDQPTTLATTKPTLKVPLTPDISTLEQVTVDLHGSPTTAYRMGPLYDDYFASCLDIPVILVYIGDGRRAILGNALLPKTATPASQPQQSQQQTPPTQQKSSSWLSSLTSYLTTSNPDPSPPTPWITFTDMAPLMIASESSLREVNTRLTLPSDDNTQIMYKFRPNIVLSDPDLPAWDEDFWAELTISPTTSSPSTQDQSRPEVKLELTGNCVRCTSLNVDYDTGKPAEGELGSVLKKLMRDRRVDKGMKWSPVFGRYASLGGGCAWVEGEGVGESEIGISVGDEVQVTGRNEERSVWDWPI